MRIIPIVLTILMLTLLIPMHPTTATDPIIDGNKIYIDDPYVYLSASPHTMGSAGWVTLEFQQKQTAVNIDCAFGFNTTTITKVSKFQLWTNYTHEKIVYIPFTQQVLSNQSGTWTWINITNYNRTIQNISYFDWKPLNVDATPISYDYMGMNKWWTVQDLPIIQNHLYTTRIFLDVPFTGLTPQTGAYIFAVKPHSLSMQQAQSQGYLYILDPWWNATWLKAFTVFINKSCISSTLINFPVGIRLNSTVLSKCNANGSDLRFVADDNTTLLNYEIENISQGVCWVNITKVYSDQYTAFNVYYNNSLALDMQTPTGVWSYGYNAVYHMNDSLILWDSTANHYSSTSFVGARATNITGKWGTGQNFTVGLRGGYLFGDVLDVGIGQFSVELWGGNKTWAGLVGSKFIIGKYPGAPGYELYASSLDSRTFFGEVYDGVNVQDIFTGPRDTIINNSWRYVNWRRPTLLKTEMSIDASWFNVSTSAAMGNVDNGGHFTIGSKEDNTQWFEGFLDEVRVRIGTVSNDSWINATFYNTNNSEFFIYELPPPVYAEVIYLGSPYPANGTNDMCPCGFTFSFNSTSSNGSSVNYIWYLRIKKNNIVDPLTFEQMNRTFNITANSTSYFSITNDCDILSYSFHHTNVTMPCNPVNTWRYLWFPDTIDEPFANKNVNFSYPLNNYTWRVLISGLYLIRYQMKFADSGAAPVSYVTTRVLVNGLEAHGSIMRTNMDKKDSIDVTSSQILKQLYVGDNITYQFQASHATVSLKSTSVAGDEPYSASVLLQKIEDPLPYNSTFYWYVNISKSTDATIWNQSGIFVFNTTTNSSGCGGGGGSSYAWTNYTNWTNNSFYNWSNSSWTNFTNTTGDADTIIGDDGIGVIGTVGLLGLLGYIVYRRRRRT